MVFGLGSLSIANSKRKEGTVVPIDFNNLNPDQMALKILEWEKTYDKINAV
jgi:hypothetical protein